MGSGSTEFTTSFPSYKSSEYDGAVGAGLDPCLAVRTSFKKQGDRYFAVLVHMACGDLRAAAYAKKLLDYDEAKRELEAVTEKWKVLSSKVRIETGRRCARPVYQRLGRIPDTLLPRIRPDILFTSAAAPTASATSFRMSRRFYTPAPKLRGPISCAHPRTSFLRETFSTGGITRKRKRTTETAASAQNAATIFYGFPTRCASILKKPAITEF